MKTLLRSLCLALASATLLTTPLRAAEKPKPTPVAGVPQTFSINMYPKIHSTKMNLMLENPYGLRLRVRLLNEKNEVLYNEILGRRQLKYWRKFEMGSMRDGRYRLEVSNGLETQSGEFTLSTGPVLTEELGRRIAIR
jgi:hypothetical protein